MNELKAVIYTDGGAESPRGAGGCGVHGYTYSETTTPPEPKDDSYYPTTGGYHNTVTKPSKVEWVQPIEYFEGLLSYPMAITNNIAELGGVLMAFEIIREKKWKNVLIRPDSQYVMLNYRDNIEKWKANGWTGSTGNPLANIQLWERMLQFKEEFAQQGVVINWQWVKGHSDDIGNQRADSLATVAKGHAKQSRAYRNVRFEEAEPVNRVTPKNIPVPNRMLSFPRWYFLNTGPTTEKDKEGRFVYYGGSHGGEDELFAKPMPDSTFCVAIVTTPDPVMEAIRAKQHEIHPNGYDEVTIGYLDSIQSSKTYRRFIVNGTRWLDTVPGTYNLFHGENQLITQELTTPRLAFNAIETLTTAESILRQYLDGKLEHDVTVSDITSTLFDIDEKKKKRFKLKPELTTASKTHQIAIQYTTSKGEKRTINTRMILGQDCPRRNDLSGLAPDEPKVNLLSWKRNDGAILFATVVETESDACIWYGHPANYRVIPKE